MKIVHAADLHIDSPLRGLERYPGVPADRVRNATRQAFSRVIDLCLREPAAFLVLAGDVFDGDWRDYNSGLFFARELGRLREVGCRVLLLRGNHDAASDITHRLDFADHVYQFPVERPDAIVFEREGVVFHGMSYRTREVTDNLVRLYPEPRRDVLNVGVLHSNVGGQADHQPYAPCDLPDLVTKRYHYWALGHVHAHAVLHREPWVVYPGNTQGRHVRETGPKGCVVVDVEDAEVRRVRFVETSVMRYHRVEVRLSSDDDREALLGRAREVLERLVRDSAGQLAAVRLDVRGPCRAHADVTANRDQLVAQLRSEADEVSDDLWLEKVNLETRPAVPIEELRAAPGLVGELLRHTDAVRHDPLEVMRMSGAHEGLAALRRRLKAELEEAGLDLDDPSVLARLLGEAEAVLAEKLTEGGARGAA